MSAEAAPPFQAVPIAELPPDAAPKRRRRPRDPNAPATKRRARSLEPQIGAALTTLNLAFWAIPPLRDDALEAVEIEALAKAIDAQARTSPTFRRYLVIALEATSGGQLMMVLVVIGARRLSRHGFLPAEVDAALGMMLSGIGSVPPMPIVESSNGSEPDEHADE